MSSTSDDHPTQTVVHVEGEVDLASAGEFGARLSDAISVGAETVVVDLTNVGFMDSAGVNTILNARLLAERAGVRLVLRGPNGETGRILDLFGL